MTGLVLMYYGKLAMPKVTCIISGDRGQLIPWAENPFGSGLQTRFVVSCVHVCNITQRQDLTNSSPKASSCRQCCSRGISSYKNKVNVTHLSENH